MKKHILVILALFLILSVAASAHSGRTDSQGGHHSSSGGYHYHHGYPAHQHTGGVCPYDYDDKTGENSGSSSGDSWVVSTDPGASDRFFYHDGLPAHQHVAGLCPYDYIGGSSESSSSSSEEEPPNIILIAVTTIGLALLVKLTVTVVRNKKREAEERRLMAEHLQAERADLIAKCSGKTRTQIAVDCGMSPELYIDDKDLPHDIFTDDIPDRCTVYVANNASVYHRNPRCRQALLSPTNIAKVRHLNPCLYCNPCRIDLEWYGPYKDIIRLMRKHDIEPVAEDNPKDTLPLQTTSYQEFLE